MGKTKLLNIIIIVIDFLFGGSFLLLQEGGENAYSYLVVLVAIGILPYIYFNIDDHIGNKIFLYILTLVMCVKIAYSPTDIVRHPDRLQKEAIGKFIKKQDGYFYYTVNLPNKQSEIWQIKVSESIYHNETKEFVKLREYAVITTNPNQVKSFEADEASFKSNLVFKTHSHYTEELYLLDCYHSALQYPCLYFEKYGLNIVYRAKLIKIDMVKTIVEFNNEFNQKKTIGIKADNKKKFKEGDSLLIFVNVNYSNNTEAEVVVYPENYNKYNYMDYFGFRFSDTIVSYKTLFTEIPQLKNALLNSYNLCKYPTERCLAYYLELKYHNSRPSYYSPVYFYYDENGKLQTFESKVQMLSAESRNLRCKDYKKRDVILLDCNRGEVISYDLSSDDLLKEEALMYYDKNSLEVDTLYLVEAKNVKTNMLYSEVDVSFFDSDYHKYELSISVPITSSVKYAILKKGKNGFESVDRRFYSQQNYNKLKKDGYGFLYKDNIFSQKEIENQQLY